MIKTHHTSLTLPALALAGFFLAACVTPAAYSDQPSPLAAAGASVCRDQWGRPAPGFEWSAWLESLERRNDNELNRHTMTDAERVRFLSAYNDTPPVTDHNPERIEVFSLHGHPLVVVVFVEDGCVTLTALMLRALVEGVISSGGARRPLRPVGRAA